MAPAAPVGRDVGRGETHAEQGEAHTDLRDVESDQRESSQLSGVSPVPRPADSSQSLGTDPQNCPGLDIFLVSPHESLNICYQRVLTSTRSGESLKRKQRRVILPLIHHIELKLHSSLKDSSFKFQVCNVQRQC